MPQFDTSYYFSQLFWLVVCSVVLIWAFKNVFVPRMNSKLLKRNERVKDATIEAEKFEKELNVLRNRVDEIQNNALKKSFDIVAHSRMEAADMISKKMQAVKNENEKVVNAARTQLNDEINSLESAFKCQIEKIAESMLDQIFVNEK